MLNSHGHLCFENKDLISVSDKQALAKQYCCELFAHSFNIVKNVFYVKASNHGVQ
jgi:hypothetical protein